MGLNRRCLVIPPRRVFDLLAFCSCALALAGCVSLPLPGPGGGGNGGQQSFDSPETALSRVNFHRGAAGLSPVSLDSVLSAGCAAHAEYLRLNLDNPAVQSNPHTEIEGLAGFSPEGRDAAAASDIESSTGGAASTVGAVEGWMATLYHRIPILRPHLARVGFGANSNAAVLDVIRGLEGAEPDEAVAYPADGQTDLPRRFSFFGESPDPFPPGAPRPGGYPITLQFPLLDTLVGFSATLTDSSGNPVTFHYSDAEHPAASFPQQNTICLIPVQPLAATSRFTVTVTGTRNGSAFNRTWSFTTGSEM